MMAEVNEAVYALRPIAPVGLSLYVRDDAGAKIKGPRRVA